MPAKQRSARRQRLQPDRGRKPVAPSVLRAISKRSPEKPWQHVTGLGGAVRLAELVSDRRRKQAIVGVTVPKWSPDPLVDMDALMNAIGDQAQIVLVEDGDPIAELAKRLPNGLGVHGGALRIWFPFEHRGPTSNRHPRLTIRERGEGDGAIEWVCEQIGRYRAEQVPLPRKGEDVTAVVSRVQSDGVELTLTTGRTARADRLHLTRISGLMPDRVVRPGQTVIVRVADPKARPVRASLVEHEPDPWQRVGEECRPGRVIACRVRTLQSFGAFVDLLPGADGLIRTADIGEEWIGHPEQRLHEGQQVAARIVNVDLDAQRIGLSMREINEHDLPAHALALYPGGPSWLDEIAAPVRGEREETSHADEQPAPHTTTAGEAEPPPQPETVEPAHLAGALPVNSEAPAGKIAQADSAAASSPPAESLHSSLVRLLNTIAQQIRALDERHRGLQEMLVKAPETIARLPREVSELEIEIRRLERDIHAAERRAAQHVEDRGVPARLHAAAGSVDGLRRQIAVSERARHQAIDEAVKAVGQANREADAKQQAQRRTALLERLAPNIGEGDLFIAECMEAWESSTEPDDRTKYPWRTPILNESFLPSLQKVHVRRDRVAATCALAACSRIHEVPGAEVHPLRTGKGASAPQRRREDGAGAWRCSISEGPGAVRLHFWQLPDGTVELWKIGYHDDMPT